MRTPPRLLIVEDDPMNLDILKTCLGTYGYEILMATDGEAGLAAAKKHRPDLAILDVMMPKMDGVEVCRRLKRDPTSSFMPIIILTARIDSQDIVAGLDAGADEYLTKPVDQAALAARVRSMLRIKELQDTTQDKPFCWKHGLPNWRRRTMIFRHNYSRRPNWRRSPACSGISAMMSKT